MMIFCNMERNQWREKKVMSASCSSSAGNSVKVVKKGAWTQEEDNLLRKCIEKYGEGKWHQVPHRAGLNRCRKSCRLRWLNYLAPNIKKGNFDLDEIDLVIRLHKLLGNRWSLIAGRLPGRTGNDVKNFWNTRMKKKGTEESIILQKPESSNQYFIRKNSNESTKITSSSTILIKPRPRTLSKNYLTWLNQNIMQTTADKKVMNSTKDYQRRNPTSNNNGGFVQESLMSNKDDMQWLNGKDQVSEVPYWPLFSSFEDEMLGGNLWSESLGGTANIAVNSKVTNDFGNFCI